MTIVVLGWPPLFQLPIDYHPELADMLDYYIRARSEYSREFFHTGVLPERFWLISTAGRLSRRTRCGKMVGSIVVVVKSGLFFKVVCAAVYIQHSTGCHSTGAT